MKHHRVISTAVLILFLGTIVPAFAQNAEDNKVGSPQQTPQAQPQPTRVPDAPAPDQPTHAQPAQPTAQPAPAQESKQQPTPVPPAPRKAQPQAAADTGGGQYGRITSANYDVYFGQNNSFHMVRPRMIGGYNRFHYGSYWFGFKQPWPAGWNYRDTVYVVYDGGAYYLHDLKHPGIQLTLSMF
jgi:hypothetical protein